MIDPTTDDARRPDPLTPEQDSLVAALVHAIDERESRLQTSSDTQWATVSHLPSAGGRISRTGHRVKPVGVTGLTAIRGAL